MKVFDWRKNARELWDLLRLPEMNILPAHLAYFLILSMVPLLLIIIIITVQYEGSATIVVDFIKNNFPEAAGDILLDTFTRTGFDLNIILFVLLSMFIASGGLYSVIVAANMLYDNKAGNALIRRLKAFFMTGLLLVLFFFMLVVMAFGNNIINLLGEVIVNDLLLDYARMVFVLLRWPVAFISILVVINIIYTLAPDDDINIGSTFWGALVTTIMWILVTNIYAYWVDNFASYDLIYGSFSTLIVMMIWIYALSYFLILGLAINARIHYNKMK